MGRPKGVPNKKRFSAEQFVQQVIESAKLGGARSLTPKKFRDDVEYDDIKRETQDSKLFCVTQIDTCIRSAMELLEHAVLLTAQLQTQEKKTQSEQEIAGESEVVTHEQGNIP